MCNQIGILNKLRQTLTKHKQKTIKQFPKQEILEKEQKNKGNNNNKLQSNKNTFLQN